MAWDLGCLHASAPPFGHRDPRLLAKVRAAYGDGPDQSAIDVFIAARRFQVATWAVLLAQGQQDRRQAAHYLDWLRAAAREALDA